MGCVNIKEMVEIDILNILGFKIDGGVRMHEYVRKMKVNVLN